MYARGDGVPKDKSQALIWLRKAADTGSDVALFNLGLTYASALPPDFAKAAVWYRKAADKGN